MDALSAVVGAAAVTALASALYKALLDSRDDARKARDQAIADGRVAVQAVADLAAELKRANDAAAEAAAAGAHS